MKRKIFLIAGLMALFTAVFYNFAQAQIPSEEATWQAKVDAWVLETADPALAVGDELPETEFLVYLAEQGDVSLANTLATKEQKGTYVYETLTAVANRTQPAVISQLDNLGAAYRPFWVVNMIWVRGNMDVVRAMAQRDDVAQILANPTVPMNILPTTDEQMQRAIEAIEWNITMVDAPDVWAAGVTGAGAVIGGQDTGYDWDHPALINQYRGWDGATADHNYNWHDSIHSGGGTCGANSPQPCDDHGHGTHTMGTMVGNDMAPSNPNWPAGATNAIGMAPGARWIGCRNMDQGNGTPATYTECYEWFIAPTDLNGNNPDPTMAPHVINNSWGCPASEGCTPGSLEAVVQNVIAAGIVTVHSAGNSGSGCGSVSDPAATYDESFSVGATTSGDTIASYSSRGPSAFDNGRKPDISAPGSGIRSAAPGTGYQSMSGTSMAGPHVAGLVGLLISAEPALAGHVANIEDLIEFTAVPKTSAQLCGDDQPGDVPNNVYGYGRIDALNAYNNIPDYLPFNLALQKTGPAISAAGEYITYTLTLQNGSPVSVTNNVVLTDVIPADTTFITATLPHTFDGDMVQWDAATLDPDAIMTVTLVVATDSDTAVTMVENSQYAARSDEVATVFGLPVQTEIVPFALAITKTASAAAVMPGEWLTYTLSVENLNTIAATHNVVLTDVVPANSIFVTATLPFSFDGTTVQWENDTLAASGVWEIEMVVTTPLSTTAPLVENADYSVLSDEVTTVAGLPVQTTITPIPQSLMLYKSASADEIMPGDWLTYTLTVTNPHPALSTTNVVLTDVLPINSTLITATLPFTQDGSTIYWQTSVLAAGESWSVRLVVSSVVISTTYSLRNEFYGVRSDEVETVSGPPVITFVGIPYRIFLPFITQE